MTSPYLDTPVMSLAERREKLYAELLGAEAHQRLAIVRGCIRSSGHWRDIADSLRAQLDNLTEE